MELMGVGGLSPLAPTLNPPLIPSAPRGQPASAAHAVMRLIHSDVRRVKCLVRHSPPLALFSHNHPKKSRWVDKLTGIHSTNMGNLRIMDWRHLGKEGARWVSARPTA
jgi:hypothetical protein